MRPSGVLMLGLNVYQCCHNTFRNKYIYLYALVIIVHFCGYILIIPVILKGESIVHVRKVRDEIEINSVSIFMQSLFVYSSLLIQLEAS